MVSRLLICSGGAGSFTCDLPVGNALFPVSSLAPVIALIPNSGKTRAELPPAAARAAERQYKRCDYDLAKVAEGGTENFATALIAKGQILFFWHFAAHTYSHFTRTSEDRKRDLPENRVCT
jgi:hypothetical protein